METQKRFRILNYQVVLFAFSLLFSCEQWAPVEEPVAVLEEFQDLSGLTLEPEDDLINGRLCYTGDCESDCLEPGSGKYFAMKDSKSKSSGIDTKQVSYKAYNTEDCFVVKVKYQIKSGPSQEKACILIQINGKSKEFKTVPSGYTATFSIPLDKGWEKCDQVTFSISQKGLGSPISFSEDYNLIPVCKTEDAFTDPRDGQVYRIVKIGDQTWFAENLNYVIGNSQCYDNDPSNCQKYGRLYDWNTAMIACPKGWHLPSFNEWIQLSNYLGGGAVAGGKLKSISGWNPPNAGATNETGFSALPAGSLYDGSFIMIGQLTIFWASETLFDNFGRRVSLYSSFPFLEDGIDDVRYKVSCRCLKD